MSRPSPGGRQWFFLVTGVLVVIAAATRFHELGRRAIWFDEGVTLGLARMPFREFLEIASRPDLSNQILYYLAVRPWHLLGESEIIIRAFSAILSAANVGLVAFLGRRLFGTAAGLAAGLVLSLHWFSIRYAQEARAYGLATFLVTLAALMLTRYVQEGRRRDLVAWSILSGLASYAHFFSLFPIAAQVVSLGALGWGGWMRRKGLFAGIGGIVAAGVPIVVLLLGAPRNLLDWVPPVSWSRIADVATCLAGGKTYFLVFVLALFGALLWQAIRWRRPEKRWAVALVVAWALLPLSAMAALSVWQTVLFDRYLSMSVPAWALVVGAVLGPLLERRPLRPVGAALLAFVVAAELDMLPLIYVDPYEDWRAAAMGVAEGTGPGDAILYDHHWGGLAFEFYLDQATRRPDRLQRGNLVFDGGFDPEEAARRGRVWVVFSRQDLAGSARIQQALRPTHPRVSGKDYGMLRVFRFDPAGPF